MPDDEITYECCDHCPEDCPENDEHVVACRECVQG